MTYYRYNSLDIAAYIKWTSMPPESERVYLDLIFQMRDLILARPLAKDFDSFTKDVFREMYHLWARGFENEFSDINLITPENSISLVCDQEFIALESYMKLIALHLILADNLPYVRINFAGLPLLLGMNGDFAGFEQNLALAADMLRLKAKDSRGNDFDLHEGVPNELLCIALQENYRKALFGTMGYRVKSSNDYQEKMRILREKSRREQDESDSLRTEIEKRREKRAEENLKNAISSQRESSSKKTNDLPTGLDESRK